MLFTFIEYTETMMRTNAWKIYWYIVCVITILKIILNSFKNAVSTEGRFYPSQEDAHVDF